MMKDILRSSLLFDGLNEEEFNCAYSCIIDGAKKVKYSKGETIMNEGGDIVMPGIVISGYVEASRVDRNGKESLVARIDTGDMFGEVLNAAERKVSPITLRPSNGCEVVFVSQSKILTPCSSLCPCHMKTAANLLKIISRKYWAVQTRLDYVFASSLREKIKMYLSDMQALADGSTFSVPFDRESLARYLNADRSALCRELSAMKRDGLIDYNKNRFTVKFND